MSNFKKRLRLLSVLAALACAVLLASSCDSTDGGAQTGDTADMADTGETEPADTQPDVRMMTCKVTVKDHTGAPMQDIVVGVLKGEGSAGTRMLDAEGTATFELAEGEYTVSLTSPEGDYYYDSAACVLTPDAPELTVTLYNKASDAIEIWAYSEAAEDYVPYEAYYVEEGATYVSLTEGDMAYFVFVPTRQGIYEISYAAESELDIGYYGNQINVFRQPLLDTVDNTVTLEVHASSINLDNIGQSAHYVFGIKSDSDDAKSCVLTIDRIGDAKVSINDQPWEELIPDETYLKPYGGVRGSTVVDLDITDPTTAVVFNEADGYYHFQTPDGPVVFVRLTSESKYIASFQTIYENQRIGVIIYDEEGNFVRKEQYHELLEASIELCDDNGGCPLTPQLAYMIQTFGAYQRWWDLSFEGHIFGTDPIIPGIAWLFPCYYYI